MPLKRLFLEFNMNWVLVIVDVQVPYGEYTEMANFSSIRSWKSEPSQEKTRDHEKLNGSSFEPSQDHVHFQTCDIGSFDDFLSYLRVPPPVTTSDW